MCILAKSNSTGAVQLDKVITYGLTVLDSYIPIDEVLLTRCRVIGGSCFESASATKVPVIPAHCPAAPVYPAPMVVHIIPAQYHDSNTHNNKTQVDNHNHENNSTSSKINGDSNNDNDVMMTISNMWLYCMSLAFGLDRAKLLAQTQA